MSSRREHGYGLLEMLVATTLTALIMGGVLSMLSSTQFTHVDLTNRSGNQQSARIAMNWLQRDIAVAGVGLSPITPVFPLVIPRQDGGVSIRLNANATTELITGNTSGRSRINVPDSLGIGVGNQLIIYDNTGTFDLTVVTSANENSGQLTVEPRLTRDYTRAAGTAVAPVQQVEYYVTSGTLFRELDGEDPVPIATGVTSFQVRYFDDQLPPAEFTPDTDERQVRIRVVEVTLRVRSGEARLQGGEPPETELRARISPRALSISRS